MTLSELISAVRDEVRDPSALRFSDAAITRYLNDGLLELARVSKRVEVWQSSVAAGTAAVTMPTDLLFLRMAAWESGGSKHGLDIKYGMPRTQPNETGEPEAVWVVSGQIVLEPVPSSSGTLYLAGVPRPPKLVNTTDTTPLEDADSAIIAYAAWRCLLADGDPMAGAQKQAWQELRDAWLVADAQRNPMQTVLERRPWWW